MRREKHELFSLLLLQQMHTPSFLGPFCSYTQSDKGYPPTLICDDDDDDGDDDDDDDDDDHDAVCAALSPAVSSEPPPVLLPSCSRVVGR